MSLDECRKGGGKEITRDLPQEKNDRVIVFLYLEYEEVNITKIWEREQTKGETPTRVDVKLNPSVTQSPSLKRTRVPLVLLY